MRSLIAALTAAALLNWAAPASGTDATRPAPTPAARPAELRVLSPSLGRPVFVAAEGNFSFTAVVPAEATSMTARLVTMRPIARTYDLQLAKDAAPGIAAGQPAAARLPADVAPGTYDLVLSTGAREVVARHCVAVGPLPRRLRFVHLSDMNVGDPLVQRFDERLVEEVNLLGPQLIICTGDYLDATHADPATGWSAFCNFLTGFDAPALVACGDHDDLAHYSEHVAPSPAGEVDIGPLRAVVLYDLPGRPLARDAQQLAWAERALCRADDARLAIVVAHNERPSLLEAWQARGELAQMVRAARLGLWFAGGGRDWDGHEHRQLLDAATPLLYLRTQQSSPLPHDHCEGVSHYRVVDVVDDQALLPARELNPAAPPSLTVGKLTIDWETPNDGRHNEAAFVAANRHSFRFQNLRATVLLRAAGDETPWCEGAELLRAVRTGDTWECRLGFDLPEKGARRVVAGVGQPPEFPKVDVQIEAPSRLVLQRRHTIDGVPYHAADDALVLIHLRNQGGGTARVTPLLRLDGCALNYIVLDEPGPPGQAYRLALAPDQTLTLQADLSALRVTPGSRELQVYLQGPPAWWPTSRTIRLSAAPGGQGE